MCECVCVVFLYAIEDSQIAYDIFNYSPCKMQFSVLVRWLFPLLFFPSFLFGMDSKEHNKSGIMPCIYDYDVRAQHVQMVWSRRMQTFLL